MIRSPFRAVAIALMAVAMMTAAMATVSSSSAEAAVCRQHGSIAYASGIISANAYLLCGAPGEEWFAYDEESNIQRLDPGTGVWYTLVSGAGWITYRCTGTQTNTFRMKNPWIERRVTATCT